MDDTITDPYKPQQYELTALEIPALHCWKSHANTVGFFAHYATEEAATQSEDVRIPCD